MKSKISFFNKTIYLKNITLYWPIWGLYLLCLLLSGPAMLWLFLREEAIDPSTYHKAVQLEVIGECTDLNWALLMSVVMALLTAMALFNYLSVSKSANMMHAFPVSRMELYGTNLLSGFTFLFVPQIITFMIKVFICLAYGASGVEYLAMWLLVSMGVSFFFFSIAVFCTFLTGQVFAVPVYYGGIIFLYDIIRVAVGMVIDFIGYGIDFSSMYEYMNANWLSPAHYLWDVLGWQTTYKEVGIMGDAYCNGLILRGGTAVALYLIPAVILLVVAYVFYKKRHIETSGDLITVPWLKPVFRWGISFFAGYFLGIAVCAILEEFYITVSKVGFLFAVLFISWIFFFVSDMCIQKSFKVFQKKRLIESAAFAVFMIITFGIINLVINAIEHYIPEKDEIKYLEAEINYNLPIELKGEEIDAVLELHETIVEHMDEFRDNNRDYEEGQWVYINYHMNDGDTVTRDYWIPNSEVFRPTLEQIREYERNPRHYLNYYFGTPYEDAVVVEGYLESYSNQHSEYDGYYGEELTLEEAHKLYDAVVQDALAGTLQKYNDSWFYYENYDGEEYEKVEEVEESVNEQMYEIYISLTVRNTSEAEKEEVYYREYGYVYEEWATNHAYLSFGPDCTNIIQALIDIGFIQSESDLANYLN